MNRITNSLIVLLFCTVAHAQIRLPALVGNDMVLQRDQPIKIWGYASAGEDISISFAGKTTKAKTDDSGKWKAVLPALKAGGPYEITLTGKNQLVLKNILLGDVWLCSGQSNMEFPVQDGLYGEEEIAAANYPQIRFFSVEKKITLSPQEDTKGSWQVCTPGAVKYFPAVGYFFGRKINTDVHVPIGLINASWGGTVIESWISKEGLASDPDYKEKAMQVASFDTLKYNSIHRKMNEDWVSHFNLQDEGFKNNTYLWAAAENTDWGHIKLPDRWEFTGKKDLWEMDGIVWFSKLVELTPADLKGDAVLTLGVIQNKDNTFINGQPLGSTADIWGKFRCYPVPAGLLKNGKNIITVRVENYGGDGGFSGKPEDLTLKTASGNYSLAGDWKYKIGYKLNTYDRPEKEISPNTLPTLMYNDMIHPVTAFAIKGVLWYQGEANWARGYQYRRLFPEMIADWRKKFNQGDFPFLYVQLANYHEKANAPADSYMAEVREAQDLTQKVTNTGMITATDVGDAANIHPKDKQTVGLRLALMAEKEVYHLAVSAHSPAFEKAIQQGNKMVLYFRDTENGLKTKDNKAPGNFQIAGADQHFYWAKATLLNGKTISVYSDEVKEPVAVRYAWEDNPSNANVVNSTGFPLLPFRTDQWKGISADKK